MLQKQFSIGRDAGIIRLRVSPTVQQIAALAGSAARMRSGLSGCRAVVDHPDFAQVMYAEHDLIQARVVVNAVGVQPVGVRVKRVVDINQLGVIANDAKVGLGVVKVLDQMVPDIPFPNDIASGRSSLLNLYDLFRPEFALIEQVRVAARGYGCRLSFQFPCDYQHVTVGQPLHIMMMQILIGASITAVLIEPCLVSVPILNFNLPTGTGNIKCCVLIGDFSGSQQRTVFQ